MKLPKITFNTRKNALKTLFVMGFFILFLLLNIGLQNNHSSVSAQPSSWPTSWTALDTDPDEMVLVLTEEMLITLTML